MKKGGMMNVWGKGYVLACAALAGVWTSGAGVEGRLDAQVLATGGGRVLLLSPAGEVLWEHKAGNIHDAWRLANGNVLFADGKVTEVTPDHRTVFHYAPEEQRGGGAFSCQRLANGNTVVGENAAGRVVEVDRDGRVVFTLQTQPVKVGGHHNLRMVRKLKNGNYLVCHSGANLVREYRPDGTVAWERKAKALAFAAVRLASGNTVISSLNQITEYDRDGNEVWEFRAADLPDAAIRNMTGFQVLPDGNLVIGCYSAYDKTGAGTGMFEIGRDRRLVWRYVSPGLRDKSMMGVHKLAAGA
ncbi:MAG: PQQ-binding-like beta-propeller repeat protein, partial [Kiritimatiellia bacterium]|nr:PQQ-binding-like beta-propeller repeat protein [Kiritimatiellia bacterium]